MDSYISMATLNAFCDEFIERLHEQVAASEPLSHAQFLWNAAEQTAKAMTAGIKQLRPSDERSVVCPMNFEEKKCRLKPCKTCGFFPEEIERRNGLPLVELDNGLYGKRVGTKHPDTED